MHDPLEGDRTGREELSPQRAAELSAHLMRVLDRTHAAFEAAVADRDSRSPAARAARHYARRTRWALN
ncbi:MAG TPA: hypothetical protein VHV82_11755 [Sporichthyaceae bacterium]|jgi:hypothetical protein|nr:hypothetical protein [Sporichthyaceae bacterium]